MRASPHTRARWSGLVRRPERVPPRGLASLGQVLQSNEALVTGWRAAHRRIAIFKNVFRTAKEWFPSNAASAVSSTRNRPVISSAVDVCVCVSFPHSCARARCLRCMQLQPKRCGCAHGGGRFDTQNDVLFALMRATQAAKEGRGQTRKRIWMQGAVRTSTRIRAFATQEREKEHKRVGFRCPTWFVCCAAASGLGRGVRACRPVVRRRLLLT